MASSKSKPVVSESRLFVLALGLLVGFAMAFVLLLSRLPVDGIISQGANGAGRESEVASMNFDYYSVLPEQLAPRKPQAPASAVEPPIVFMEPSRFEPPPIRAKQPVTAAMPQIVRLPAASQGVEAAPPEPRRAEPSAPEQPEARPQALVREMLASESGQDSYYIEAGNYLDQEDALQIQSLLRTRGLDAFIVVREDNGGGFGHRVRIGPFFEQARLDATRERLRAAGIRPKLIRVKG
ncbi:MAG: SPOR domain-containing protein [Granulosicoccus sp.]